MFTWAQSVLTFSLFGQGSASVIGPQFEAQRGLCGDRYYDVQAHRGGRGNTVESTLPAFAWSLIQGSTTLELDNGITKDGVVVVWHDEEILASKCSDTRPAFEHDPEFPYVGKFVANLTWKQLRTLDCGSKRQSNYPLQITSPGAQIQTLKSVMDFVACADPRREVLWNIESKIDAVNANATKGVQEFVQMQHAVFSASHYQGSITYQSFDWRSLVAMKLLNPGIITSALIDSETVASVDEGLSPWLAGLRLDDYPGPSLGQRIAHAAKAIGADILSPAAISDASPSSSPLEPDFIPFTTPAMVQEAHKLGLKVKPWTVNRLDVAEQLARYGVDGIITDYPDLVRRWAREQGFHVAPKFPKKRVFACLKEHSALSH